MAEENKEQGVSVHEAEGEVEVKDRGLFDFIGKKDAEEKKPEEEDSLAAGVQNIHIEEGYKAPVGKEEDEKQHEKGEKEEEKQHGLLDKLRRSHSSSSSSSSSDEEEEVEGEGGIKEKVKKKKKAVKEKIEGKAHEEEEHKPAFAPPQHVEEPKVQLEEVELHEPAAPEGEKKGFLEKIKQKLPGHSKKSAEEGVNVPPPDAVEPTGEHAKVQEAAEGTEGKEKKGFIGKIIEKLPGYHKSTGEEGDKGPASH